MTDKVFVPPLKIQGIKTKLVPIIRGNVELFSDSFWVEPFMGSGVVGFNVAGKNAVFADKNPHIITFYNAIKDGTITSSEVRMFLEKEGEILSKKNEEHYYFVRERFNRDHDPLDFLFLNRSCFNGMMRFNKKHEFNVPYGHKPQRFAKAYITKIVNQVARIELLLKENDWTFLCRSFEELIPQVPSNSFIYCDPPYIGRHVDYYDCWDENSEHLLRKKLEEVKTPFMVSSWKSNQYRNNEYIDTVWGGCFQTLKDHFYYVGAKEKNRNSVTEVLLTNYNPKEIRRKVLSDDSVSSCFGHEFGKRHSGGAESSVQLG